MPCVFTVEQKLNYVQSQAAIAIAKLVELHYKLLTHPLYSLDLAPCDFFYCTWKNDFAESGSHQLGRPSLKQRPILQSSTNHTFRTTKRTHIFRVYPKRGIFFPHFRQESDHFCTYMWKNKVCYTGGRGWFSFVFFVRIILFNPCTINIYFHFNYTRYTSVQKSPSTCFQPFTWKLLIYKIPNNEFLTSNNMEGINKTFLDSFQSEIL